MKKLEKLIRGFLEKKTAPIAYVGAFSSVIFLRVFVEQFLAKAPALPFYEIIIEFIHNFYFFLISLLLIWLLLSFMLAIRPQKLLHVFSWASLLIIFPPLIDMAKTKGEVFWSFYILSGIQDLKIQFLTIFGHLPSGIVYFGTRIIFITAIVFISGLVYLQTKKIYKTLLAALGTYAILFFMGSFPSIFSYFYYSISGEKKLFEIKDFNIAQLFGTPGSLLGIAPMDIKYSFAYRLDIIYFLFLMILLAAIFYISSREKFYSVLGNFRYPQIVFHTGLFVVGMGLASLQYPGNLELNIFSLAAIAVLAISIWLAWFASVAANDIVDLEVDKISNKWRPLPSGIFSRSDYIQLGLICFFLSLLGAISVGMKFFILILSYQIIAWFYSAPPFRLKRFPLIATFVSSIALIMVFFMGYILISDNQSISTISWRIIAALLLTYTLSIPVKDFKDIAGDKQEKIWTIPVIFGETRAKLIVAAGIFISFVSSVFLINELRLFFWALAFGALSFLILVWGNIKPRRLPGIILLLVAIYGLILINVVFIGQWPF